MVMIFFFPESLTITPVDVRGSPLKRLPMPELTMTPACRTSLFAIYGVYSRSRVFYRATARSLKLVGALRVF